MVVGDRDRGECNVRERRGGGEKSNAHGKMGGAGI